MVCSRAWWQSSPGVAILPGVAISAHGGDLRSGLRYPLEVAIFARVGDLCCRWRSSIGVAISDRGGDLLLGWRSPLRVAIFARGGNLSSGWQSPLGVAIFVTIDPVSIHRGKITVRSVSNTWNRPPMSDHILRSFLVGNHRCSSTASHIGHRQDQDCVCSIPGFTSLG